MKKQAMDSEGSMDMISQLPQPLLHHILCFLSQKNAVQTCVLSKTWLEIGSTRPKIEFYKRDFPRDRETNMSVLGKILQRYHNQNLSIHDFRLEMLQVDSGTLPFLEKWIPIVILDMCVKTFDLSFIFGDIAYFDMPSAVFESKALQNLCLKYGCRLSPNSIENVKGFSHLKNLTLVYVYIEDNTLDMILSTCPLIKILVLHSCQGLRTIKLNKSHSNLKLFDFQERNDNHCSIEINAPSLENIEIQGCPNGLNLHKYLFPHLKSLYLDKVCLSSSKSFDKVLCVSPCLEELSLKNCRGIEEFHLSSRSMKSLIIQYMDKPTKVVIDAPSLVYFEFEGHMPMSISFKATASKWESRISVWSMGNFNDFDASSWCFELYEVLKGLSKSQISLDIFQELVDNEEEDEFDESLVVADTFGGLCEPIVVEHLHVRIKYHSQFSSTFFIVNLLHIFRPRNMSVMVKDEDDEMNHEDEDGEMNHQYGHETYHKLVRAFLEKVIFWEREKRLYSWQKDLEQASGKEEFDDEHNLYVVFHLIWRD